jgi:hypothetical protein
MLNPSGSLDTGIVVYEFSRETEWDQQFEGSANSLAQRIVPRSHDDCAYNVRHQNVTRYKIPTLLTTY